MPAEGSAPGTPAEGSARPGAGRAAALLAQLRSHLPSLTAFTFLQLASFVIPVVTVPFFARALGIAGMGVLAIASAVGLVAGVLMDYAIQLSGTRFASTHADDLPAINRYLNATLAVKLAILLPILAALALSSLVLSQVSAHPWVFFWALASAALMCLFPQWLFQGLLAMPAAGRILVTCRVGAAAAALLLVRGPQDLVIVPLTQAIGGLAALAAAALVLRRRFGIVPGRPAPGDCRRLLADNRSLFSATAWGASYTHGAVIIMSTMLTTTAIGFYSIAQRIAQAVVAMFNVLAQTGFPLFVRRHGRAERSFGRPVALYMAAIMGMAMVGLLVVFAVREPVYLFFAGRIEDGAITIFTLWLVAALFTIASVALSPLLVVLRLDARMARVYRSVGVAFLIAAPLACARFGALGMMVTVLLAEVAMALFFATFVRRGIARAGHQGTA